MPARARYVHTNLVARDWRTLAAFYERVFGCTRVPPERDLAGPWLDQATGLSGARIRGIHLRLPGYGDAGPTLELFQYGAQEAAAAQRNAPHSDALHSDAPNQPGFGHVAFAVDDVRAACELIVAAGGGMLGQVVTVDIAGAGTIEFAYATDPEGNLVEVQQWLT
jgi:predicted enzyme related to lactoylglutathione lyase